MDDDRVDQGGFVPEIMAGLWFSGIYILATPTVIQRLGAWENLLAVLMTIGATLVLTGLSLGSWLAPETPRSVSYRLEMLGLPIIVIVLGVLALFTPLPPLQEFTLGGGLGFLVQIGCLRLMAKLWIELRRE